jgi:murein DD-endopeptidase MepM/ murein hydrolase activator NlpD
MLAYSPNPLTLESQLKFLYEESNQRRMRDDPNTVEWIGLTRTTTLQEAVVYWEYNFERSGGAGMPQRLNYAQQALALFSGNSGSTNGGTGDPCDSVTVNGAGGIDVFPQEITQTQIRAGVEGGVWCFNATTNCHHDYNAADLHAVTGTPVLAAKAGTVVSTTNTSCGVGSRVTIKGEDNQFIYYYAHMGINTITVAEGQTVAVGQEIGKVGTRCDAVGTAPHTHFDMLPADRYDRRPSCSGASCKSFPFVDVQPNLKQLYEQLPN